MPHRRIKRIDPPILSAAKEHRNEPTPAERRLWAALRGQQVLGLPFRRQHPVGRFILDFYCPRGKLCVELDGSIHEGREDLDALRTQHLAMLGIRVLRFRNEDVLANLPSVMRTVEEALTP